MSAITVALVVLTLMGGVEPGRARPADIRRPVPTSPQPTPDPDGLTPLMRAAARGDLAQVNALLAKGADPNAVTAAQRVTALMCAAYFGRFDVIKALLARGAKLEQKDAQGAAAVDWAALGDHPELEKTLTGTGAALNPFLNTGLMPIWLMDKAAGQ